MNKKSLNDTSEAGKDNDRIHGTMSAAEIAIARDVLWHIGLEDAEGNIRNGQPVLPSYMQDVDYTPLTDAEKLWLKLQILKEQSYPK